VPLVLYCLLRMYTLKLEIYYMKLVLFSFGFWVVPIDHWDKIPIILCTNTKQSPTIFYCCSFYIFILKTKLYIFFINRT